MVREPYFWISNALALVAATLFFLGHGQQGAVAFGTSVLFGIANRLSATEGRNG